MIDCFEFFKSHPVGFLSDTPVPGNGIAISSRVRLARNLNDYPFPQHCPVGLKKEICSTVLAAAKKLPVFSPRKGAMYFDLQQLDEHQRAILLERRLASKEFLVNRDGSLLIVSADERSGIMVNEEDQLRIQCIAPGFTLSQLLCGINKIDDKLAEHLDFAYDSRYGYLTACPSNAGTGLRASVMLHLPALMMTEEMLPTIEGASKLHLAVRGLRGEGSKNSGCFFQISNQFTMGIDENESVELLSNAITRIIEAEKSARMRLLESNRTTLYDRIGRAYGSMKYCYNISLDEAFDILSLLRLGVELGLFNAIDLPLINFLQIAIQPGHLDCHISQDGTDCSCDIKRAMLCRNKMRPHR
jgi:protein arginine kinase